MKLIILFFPIFLYGQVHNVDKGLKETFYSSMTILKDNGVEVDLSRQVKVVFGNVNREVTLAQARGKHNHYIYIVFDRASFYRMSKIERIYVMIHELGHDYFNLEHSESGLMSKDISIGKNRTKDLMNDINEFCARLSTN